ncbi:DHA2 family efflux MFS transporter permease subunit [Paenibacillus sp. Soil522]|uniref:DHA2 family efflux MFS transporter permease subunit n=1 Tax=Paenibacillus sp. Soil522 TaxID=1736388 RepID=UPI001F25D532|nr:DHA2 family efflux MFS transporter permease subunit [Paenibacillus sp. Soil522]
MQQKKGVILISIALGLVLTALDNTIVSANVNKIIDDIGGLDKVTWIYTTYALAGASTMLIFGKLSDLFGRKTLYLVAIGIFLLGSALCGTAQTIEQLSIYRVIQGIGSGGIFPISFSLIYTLYTDPKESGKLSGIFGALFGLSSIAGPQIGTWISETLSWRWCFYINMPIGIVSFVVLLLTLRESRAETKPKIDVLGAMLLVIATVCFMLALEMGGKDDVWTSWKIIALFGVSVFAIISFFFVERRAKEPILPLQLFKNRMVTGTSIVVFCQGAIMFGAMTYLPLYTNYVLGESRLNLLLTPLMLSMISGSVLMGFILTRFKIRTVMFINMSIGIVVSCLLMNLSPDVPFWQFIGIVILLGLGVLGPLNSLSQNAVVYSVDERFIGVSSSLVGFYRSMGGVMGASIMAVIVNSQMATSIKTAIMRFNLNPNSDPAYHPPDTETVLRYKERFEPDLVSYFTHVMDHAITQGFVLFLCLSVIGAIAALMVGSMKIKKRTKGTPQTTNAPLEL